MKKVIIIASAVIAMLFAIFIILSFIIQLAQYELDLLIGTFFIMSALMSIVSSLIIFNIKRFVVLHQVLAVISIPVALANVGLLATLLYDSVDRGLSSPVFQIIFMCGILANTVTLVIYFARTLKMLQPAEVRRLKRITKIALIIIGVSVILITSFQAYRVNRAYRTADNFISLLQNHQYEQALKMCNQASPLLDKNGQVVGAHFDLDDGYEFNCYFSHLKKAKILYHQDWIRTVKSHFIGYDYNLAPLFAKLVEVKLEWGCSLNIKGNSIYYLWDKEGFLQNP
jgi:uncharacterized protein Usg